MSISSSLYLCSPWHYWPNLATWSYKFNNIYLIRPCAHIRSQCHVYPSCFAYVNCRQWIFHPLLIGPAITAKFQVWNKPSLISSHDQLWVLYNQQKEKTILKNKALAEEFCPPLSWRLLRQDGAETRGGTAAAGEVWGPWVWHMYFRLYQLLTHTHTRKSAYRRDFIAVTQSQC